MMVVSPFIDCETLEWLNNYRPNQEKVLVTRMDSLTHEIMRLYDREKAEVWVMSPVAEQNDVQPMNLHAKMYYSWGARTGGIHLWLGSANATRNGFYRNSEFLLRLTCRRGKNQFQEFKNEFCDESKQLCRKIDTLPEYQPAETDHSISVAIRTWLVSHGNLYARVVKTENGFDVTVTAKRFNQLDAEVTVAPMQTPDNRIRLSPEQRSGTVHVANKGDLSEFYILTVTPDDSAIQPIRMVVKIPTEGIPDDRDDAIFRSILDTREKFLQYMEMVISDRPQELTAMLMQPSTGAGAGHTETPARSVAFYESLLKIAAVNPERLADIQDLVDRLDGGVVPESFRQICSVFQKTFRKLM